MSDSGSNPRCGGWETEFHNARVAPRLEAASPVLCCCAGVCSGGWIDAPSTASGEGGGAESASCFCGRGDRLLRAQRLTLKQRPAGEEVAEKASTEENGDAGELRLHVFHLERVPGLSAPPVSAPPEDARLNVCRQGEGDGGGKEGLPAQRLGSCACAASPIPRC